MSWDEEFVQVLNSTDHDIIWDGITYFPGQRRVVSYLAMVNSFGDPRALNGRPQVYQAGNGQGVIPAREDERVKVARAWMAGSGPGYCMTWDEIPTLQFFTMDNERVFTVRDDPAGEKSTPADLSIEKQRDLESIIKRQQRQIADLMAMAGLENSDFPSDDAASIPADIPTDPSASDQTQSPWAHSEPPNDL